MMKSDWIKLSELVDEKHLKVNIGEIDRATEGRSMLHALHIKQFPTVRLYKPDDSQHYAEFKQLDSGENLNIEEFKKFLRAH